ncbi:flagellar filament capping protein FliD [Pseudoduganella namucuonensis]|uniref:Flagellar hook-associated protein 2 n=1 Tax=Pseudoduganella namucuonensis TaxID=1035707 RepID=A0A1I7M4N8_9BURK|nr:flagellar filament capping protein FliD [Pseudoduganella namucuonensis]SFV16916.1 flagellar hook-associated protein 2 [Pseudoduganella namucuonensis]
MANTSVGNYGNLGAYGASGAQATTTPSASVLAKVERTLAGQTGGVARLNESLARDQTRLSGLGQLQSALTGFQSIAERLAGAGIGTSASSSAQSVLTAAAGGGAKPGSYAVEVKQLAQGQVLDSDALKTATGKIGTGATATIKVEFGTAGAGGFTPGKESAKTITIDARNNTLDGIASAFKAAGIDASVVKSGDGYALRLKGASGEAGGMRVSVGGDAAVKNLLSYNPAAKQNSGLTQSVAAQDAVAVVAGKEVKSAGNTLKDAIEGATLTLTGTGKADVAVTQDSGQIAQNVAAFVNAYNDLNGKLAALQKGELKSDQALGQVSREVAALLRTGGVSPSALAAVGVSADGAGKLQLDDKKLKAAVAADPEAVSRLFTNDGKGLADQFDAKIDALTGKSGAITRETQRIGKDITALTAKKAELAKALTSQANVLVKYYTQQEQADAGGALPGYTGPRSLFDFMA